MARRKQTRGTCSYCGRVLARSGMLRHLETCSQREAAIAAANQGTGTTEKLYHLRIQDKMVRRLLAGSRDARIGHAATTGCVPARYLAGVLWTSQ